MKSSDLDDMVILRRVAYITDDLDFKIGAHLAPLLEPHPHDALVVSGKTGAYWREYANSHALQAAYPDAPNKVLRAKVRRMSKRGLLDSCLSPGSRGDVTLTAKGREMLKANRDD
jgi:hypothetical protein